MKRLSLRLKKPTNKVINILVKLSLGIMLFLSLFALTFFSTRTVLIRLYEGDVSLRDIYAPYDFTYTGDIDEEKTKESENKALNELSPVYKLNPQIETAINQTLSKFFSNLKESQNTKEFIGDDEKLKKLKNSSPLALSERIFLTLIRADDVPYTETVVGKMVNKQLKGGIFSGSDKKALKEEAVNKVIILDPSTGEEMAAAISEIPTLDEFKKDLEKEAAEYFPKDKNLREAVLEIVKTTASSNLLFDSEETVKRREDVRANLPRIYKNIAVKKNEILINKGQKVTKRHVKMITQLGKMRELGGRFFYLSGMFLLLLILLLVSVFHLKFYEFRIFHSNKDLFLITILVLYVAVVAETVILSPLSSYFIPLASASMLIAILLGAHSAFIFTVILSIFLGVVAGNNLGLAIVMLMGSSVGIYSVRRVRRRSKLLLAGFAVGCVNFFTIISLGLLNNLNPRLFIHEGFLGMSNGLISFLLVTGLLPALEYLFKIPTDITLLELSDLNHPLLKDMATKAPGTYHHSIIVGNLAEAACDAIGANSLLARVGAYYHDIGKTEKAEYFSENEFEPKNSRHKALTPSMSALVIINHVKDGIELSHKHKLNQALMDFIEQHHGNGLIYYFYQRALEKAEDESQLKEQEFRYPGPRPQTKETAIVLLADSVEASSRTLANPTPSRVEGLVQRIVNNKFIDGQLDECDITLKDLHKISGAFVRVLNAMFHTRVEYPNEEEIQKAKNAKNNGKKSDRQADTGGHGGKADGREST